MKNMTAFRITALSCFYFALLSLVSPFRESLLPMAVTAGLILIAAFLAVRFEKPAARLAFFILPLAWVVMTAMVDWPKLALLAAGCALPVLAAALTLLLGRDMKELWRYRREFMILTGVSALLLVASVNPLIFSTGTCIFIGAYLLLSILALRAGRAGQMKSGRWQAGSAGLLLLPIVGAAGVGTLLMVGFDALMGWLKNLFADSGMKMVTHTTPDPMLTDHHFRRPALETTTGTPVPYDRVEDLTQKPLLAQVKAMDWKWILLIAILLLALAILLWFLLGNRKKDKQSEEGLEMVMENEPRSRARRRRLRWTRDDSNAGKVRDLYRQYLGYLRVKGVSFDPSETSEDVSAEAKEVTGDDAVLREIYRKARYDSGDTVTDEELRQAQAAYQRLTNPSTEEQPTAEAQDEDQA